MEGWHYYNHAMIPSVWPHENVDLRPIEDGSIWKVRDGGTPLLARWTSDWDCREETAFYWCIKDDGFDIAKLKAKLRYEINKGKKNFETRIIDPREYVDEIYSVYLDSLKGYPASVRPETRETIECFANTRWSRQECHFFGVFDKEDGRLCGYSDVYERGLYLPISSLKCRVESEKKGVNLALVAGIVEWFVQLNKPGSYLCDGERNVVHETNFQSFLIKYFGFRKAYCKLHIVYRPAMKVLVAILFPFRHRIAKLGNSKMKMVSAVLKIEAWKRGLPA